MLVDFGETMKLPINYEEADRHTRARAREQYIDEQDGKCMHCGSPLDEEVPSRITHKGIDWSLFPPNFLRYPVHLQHNHNTGMTEGAVHSYCNAVLWQYHGR